MVTGSQDDYPMYGITTRSIYRLKKPEYYGLTNVARSKFP